MGYRFAPITIFLLVALSSAILVDSSYTNFHEDGALGIKLNMCASDGTCSTIDGSGERQMMNLTYNRRVLATASHISYDALDKNKVPCNQQGSAYYNCAASGRANPYQRGCSTATRCARH